MSKFMRLFIIFALSLVCTHLYGITATEVFNDAKRAYLNDRFVAAEELFANFIETWPEHSLARSADYYLIICSAHNLDQRIAAIKKESADKLLNEINSLEDDMSDSKIALAELAVNYVQKGDFAWDDMQKLSDDKLLRVLKKGWYPSPADSPLAVLKFVSPKLKEKSLSAELKASLAYIKALALWQMVLSPLPTDLNARIIKMWGDWPVHKSLAKTLNTAFTLGDSEIKKKIALLGYHFDCFRHKGVKSSCTSGLDWFSYLSERGISRQEVWCPR